MAYLLDTHAFIWLLVKPEALSTRAVEIIQDPHRDVFVSTVSFWELALKHSIGKLDIKGVDVEDLEDLAEQVGLGIIGLNERESSSFHRLPQKEGHRDPFDRMLIWQSISRGLALISRDASFEQYREHSLRLVW